MKKMSKCKCLTIVILILIQFLQFSSQQTTSISNTCAKMLDNRMPVRPSDCTSDKSYEGNNCCYITSTYNGQTTGMCYLVPSGADVKNAGSIVSGLGIDAKVDCSGIHVKFKIFSFVIVLLFAFII